MSMINIGASNAGDQFYRYKMPAIQSKIEGRGNGIKTNVVNLVDVSKALARPTLYTLKFFGNELGAQTKFDEKSGTCIVNGAHDAGKLAQTLEGFIKRFVQCFSCGNPETMIEISKRDTIHLKCKACGALSDVDMRHKLCTFICKNPPEIKKDKKEKQLRRAEREREEAGAALDDEERRRKRKEKKEKKDKKEKKEQKENADDEGSAGVDDASSASEPDDDDDDGNDEVVWATDTSAAAAKARAEEQLTDGAAGMVTVVADKMKDASIQDESSEEEEDPRISKLRVYATKNDAAKTAEYLNSDSLGVDSLELGIYFLLEAIFDEDEPIPPQIKAKKDYVEAACPDAKTQRALLCGFERYVTETATSGFKAFSLILNQLYEFDLVEEDVIKAWNDDVEAAASIEVEAKVSQAVRKQAEKFIEWLDESEDEDSD